MTHKSFPLVIFYLLVFSFSLNATNPYSYIPEDTFAYMKIDAMQLREDFFNFFNKDNPVIKEVISEIKETAKSLGKPLPKKIEDQLDLNEMEKKLNELKKQPYFFPDTLSFFFLPKMVLTKEKAEAFLVVAEGKFNLEIIKKEAKKESPELTFKNLNYKGLPVIEILGLQEAAERKQKEKKVYKASKKVKVPEVIWAVTFPYAVLAGSKMVVKDALDNKPAKDFFKRENFSSKLDNLGGKNLFMQLVAISSPELAKKKDPFEWVAGGIGPLNILFDVKMKNPEMTKKSVANFKMKIMQGMGFVQMMGPKLSQGQPMVAKAIEHLLRLFKSIKLEEEKGLVNFSANNPGISGIAYILTGSLKAALPMLLNKFRPQRKKKEPEFK
ncbi:hypothetical protein ACFL35_03010 [Candidatus Riflebacteria bacterium]